MSKIILLEQCQQQYQETLKKRIYELSKVDNNIYRLPLGSNKYSKAKIKRLRLLIQELMLEIENEIEELEKWN